MQDKMKVIQSNGGEYSDCIVKYFDLLDFENSKNTENKVLFWGWNCINLQKEKINEVFPKQEKIFINTAQPCEIINGWQDIELQEKFDIVYTICPYTAEVLNGVTKAKYKPICFPYNEKYFKKYNSINKSDKTNDIIYYGQIHNPIYYDLIKTISNFKYSFATISEHNFNEDMRSLVTHLSLNTQEKWDLLSKTKISVGFNLLFLNDTHIENLKSIPNISKFKNIQKVYDTKTMPQMKTRMVEAALTKTLMLVYKDDWNVIENWFTPGEHFLYWENYEELQQKINHIIQNYDDYWFIIDNAHKHVKKYSLNKLFGE